MNLKERGMEFMNKNVNDVPWYAPSYSYPAYRSFGTKDYLSLTPQDIKRALEHYVVGQDEACRQVSVLMYQHLHGHRSVSMVAGPTGAGKSFITESLQKIFPDVVYLREISNLTCDGWMGPKKVSTLFHDVHNAYDSSEEIYPLIVLDECDKCFSPHVSSAGENVSESIQSELLAVVHGTVIENKKIRGSVEKIDTRPMSFMFAGAFEKCAASIAEKESGPSLGFGASREKVHSYNRDLTIDDIHEAGCIKELCGRIQKIICLDKFEESRFRSILEASGSGPVYELENEFNIQLILSENKKDEMAHNAYKSGLGMRGVKNQIRHYIDEAIWNDCGTQVVEIV